MMTDPTAWMAAHYPRCRRCNLRCYVSNATGLVVAEISGQSTCPAWNEPESERPVWPYHGSAHEV